MIDVAVLGLGAIGMKVAEAVGGGLIPGMRLAAVSAMNQEAARARLRSVLDTEVPVLSLVEAVRIGDLVVECLPPALFRSAAEPVLATGRSMVAVSVGALFENADLVDLARETGATIYVPSGAIAGLDAVRAAAEGAVDFVELTTRKPPGGFEQSAYLDEKGILLDALTEAAVLYEGSATEGVRLFPKNVNVVAALSLAGVGAETTRMKLVADPSVTRNRHTVNIRSEATEMTATIENLPDPNNPRTSMITALSVLATLRAMTAPIRF
jgi:aspartate dehydrogenase